MWSRLTGIARAVVRSKAYRIRKAKCFLTGTAHCIITGDTENIVSLSDPLSTKTQQSDRSEFRNEDQLDCAFINMFGITTLMAGQNVNRN